jgi:phosphatidylinositol alpha-1,6-mannosyltransferase
LVALAWWLPQAQQVLSMHALLLRPVLWLQRLRPRRQPLHCWLHGIEVWGAALKPVQGALQSCTGLIASSNFTRDQLLHAPGRWPAIQVVHPMADLIDAQQPPEALPSGLRLLTVARMDAGERYKGHRVVLAALRQLKQAGTLPENWQWRVVGDGNDRQAIAEQCEAWGLNHWVRFLGGVADGALEEELRHCSVLLMPSAFGIEPDGRACGEGFGIVYLEAAQAGRAAIACRQGGQSDLIVDGRTGWLIDPEPRELAALLLRLGQQPQALATAGAQARQRAMAQFSQAAFDQALAAGLGNP